MKRTIAGNMRILIVEDDKNLAATLKDGFEGERYSVDVEHDGNQGWFRARTNPYDLILLDNMLPGKQGPEICADLRRYHMDVPVLIVSAQCEVDSKVLLLNCGADDYVTKPYSWNELLARVRALLRRPHTVASAKLSVDDLVLDGAAYTVLRGETKINLATKEFALLEYLMQNAGRVVSRQALFDHVWDSGLDQFSKTIEVHIHNLRQKIDLPGHKKLIHTIPGRGYRLGDPAAPSEGIEPPSRP